MKTKLGLAALLGALAAACGPAYSGVPGNATVSSPAVHGTVFTIIFENHDESSVVTPKVPYIWQLAQENAKAAAYVTNIHPSLPNYIVMMAGDKKGIGNDNDPLQNAKIPGDDNLVAQLDAANVPWRAYMESMGAPCRMESDKLYSAHHNPFLYFDHVTQDPAYCAEHDVDFDQNFATDLAADKYKFVWITPNMCNDMHDRSAETTDAWLAKVIPQIQASPGYQNDGAIFLMFDEGSTRVFGAAADLPTIVLSPRLVSKGFVSNTRYDHQSYVATMEDIFKLPRLATTMDAVPMSEFFQGNAL